MVVPVVVPRVVREDPGKLRSCTRTAVTGVRAGVLVASLDAWRASASVVAQKSSKSCGSPISGR